MRIVHLTSVHPRYDTRIYLKMCCSLAANGADISLVVADGNGIETKNGVNIIDVGAKVGGRISRMTKTVDQIFHKAIDLDADIYHLHDPELIPAGLKLKKSGKKVIFDAHEDLVKQILSKPYLNKLSRLVLSSFFSWYEKWACPKFDAIITATPIIRDKFLKINPNTVDINNFPLLNELVNSSSWDDKTPSVAYVGVITLIRGIKEIVESLNFTNDVELNLAGKFSDKRDKDIVVKNDAWSKVNELGFLDRIEVNKLLSKSMAGIVTFHPEPNHIEAQPNKMFEYMSAGIPVITSDFPLWKGIVEGHNCGLCVNPMQPSEIGEAIQYIIDNPEMAEAMGKNGRLAVEEIYNWQVEEEKLLKLYKGLL